MNRDQPLPLDRGDAERKGRPAGGQADSGKHGGASQGGRPGTRSVAGPSHGTNAQTGGSAGREDERSAPGISTDKKADDTK